MHPVRTYNVQQADNRLKQSLQYYSALHYHPGVGLDIPGQHESDNHPAHQCGHGKNLGFG